MADQRAQSKGRSRGRQKSVLGSLPASRPERIGRTRGEVKATAAKPRTAKPKPRTAKPKPRAKTPAPKRSKPVAVTAGSPPLARSTPYDGPPPRPIGAPSGTQLVTTAIQATGELARIGFVVGGQVLKRAVDRLPRP